MAEPRSRQGTISLAGALGAGCVRGARQATSRVHSIHSIASASWLRFAHGAVHRVWGHRVIPGWPLCRFWAVPFPGQVAVLPCVGCFLWIRARRGGGRGSPRAGLARRASVGEVVWLCSGVIAAPPVLYRSTRNCGGWAGCGKRLYGRTKSNGELLPRLLASTLWIFRSESVKPNQTEQRCTVRMEFKSIPNELLRWAPMPNRDQVAMGTRKDGRELALSAPSK